MDESFLITVVGCSILGGGLLGWLLTRRVYRVRVTPLPVTVVHYARTEVAVALESRRRLALRWRSVPGTFIAKRGETGCAAVSPTLGATGEDGGVFAVQVTGLQPGVDKVRVAATPLGRKTALAVDVPVRVAEDDRGHRRIRHTAAVLNDPGSADAGRVRNGGHQRT